MLNFTKDTLINILIIISLVFFIGMTIVLIGMFVLTDVIHYKNNSDIILTMGVFIAWVAFIIAVLIKAITIYKKIPGGDLLENDNKNRKGLL